MGHCFYPFAELGLFWEKEDFMTFLEQYDQRNNTIHLRTRKPLKCDSCTLFKTFHGDREFEISAIPSDIEGFDFLPFLQNGIPNLENHVAVEHRYLWKSPEADYFWLTYPDFGPLSVRCYFHNAPIFDSIVSYYQDLLDGYFPPQAIAAQTGLISYAHYW